MKAVFLDRDGVINADRDDYVKNVAELSIFPEAPDSIRRLNEAGYAVFVVSNQQGVAKGLISEASLQAMEDKIRRQVEAAGGSISGFYYCKHLASEKCSCRKPEPGLILAAAREHGIDLHRSFMVGDSRKDVTAGERAGCKTILVLSGHAGKYGTEEDRDPADFTALDLPDAVDLILQQ